LNCVQLHKLDIRRNKMQQKQAYRWTGFKNGIGGVAWVPLKIAEAEQSRVIEAYVQSDDSYPLPADWRKAARHGVEFGLKRIAPQYEVTITDIVGTITDTNATIVAYTALRATWDKVNYTPSNAELTALEDFIYSNWTYRQPLVPDFETLTLNVLENCA
jgi:hypothetical protein